MVFHLINVIFPLKYNVDRSDVIACYVMHSPKSILQENGLQNKPFTKKHSPRKRTPPRT